MVLAPTPAASANPWERPVFHRNPKNGPFATRGCLWPWCDDDDGGDGGGGGDEMDDADLNA